MGIVMPLKKPTETFATPVGTATVPPPRPVTYQIVVEPRKPKAASVGGIVFAKRTRQADQAMQSIAKIVAIGPLAWTKESNLFLPDDQRPKVGDWIVFRQHAGQPVRIAKKGGNEYAFDDQLEEFYKILLDTDVLGQFESEEHANKFYGWVQS